MDGNCRAIEKSFITWKESLRDFAEDEANISWTPVQNE